MQCDKCGREIEEGEERQFHDRILCEDCYMDALSPPRTCDPWAVHSAKSLMKSKEEIQELSPTQQKILEILGETGGIQPAELAERLQLGPSDLEREIAALRHMEKVRGELREGKKYLIKW